jgi:hypothetical protein
METTSTEPFEQLPLARTELPMALEGQYRVYSDHKNFKLVQAISAVNALEASGLEQAFKIERESLSKSTLIKPNFSSDAVVPAEVPVEATAAPAAETPTADAAAPEAPAA